MQQKILVTGATGFVGKYVIQELLNSGMYQIIATSKSLDKAIEQSWYKEVVYIPYVIGADAERDLYQYFLQPDIVLHLAWEELGDYDSFLHIEKYLPAHYAFLKNLLQNGLKHLAVAGTCFEYGMQEGCLAETLCTNPVTVYGLAKDTLRKSLELLNKKHAFVFQWIRLFYMYGEGASKKSLISQLESALMRGDAEFKMSGAQQSRDYLSIKEVACNIMKIVAQTKVDGIINCGSGRATVIKDLVHAYVRQKKRDIRFIFGYYPYASYEPMHFYATIEKLESIGSHEK